MILVDTSVWLQFFRRGLPEFSAVLEKGGVLIHPIVLGELAMGNLTNRKQTLAALGNLPRSKTATAEDHSNSLRCIRSMAGASVGTTCNCSPPRDSPTSRFGLSMAGLRPPPSS